MTQDVRAAILLLLDQRPPEATICPSEVARVLAGTLGLDQWHDVMPEVHNSVDMLLDDGSIQLSWKGTRLDKRTGPYRIKKRRQS